MSRQPQPVEHAPRIAAGSRAHVGIVGRAFARLSGWVSGTGPPHLFLILARHRRLFLGWLHFAGRLMPGGLLPRRETELVILRVAWLRDCSYEFEHHVRLGGRAGLDHDDIARVTAGHAAPGWTIRERVLLAAVELLHHVRDLDDTSWAALRECFSERECIELCLLVGHYEMLATFIATMRIESDPPRRRGRLGTRLAGGSSRRTAAASSR